MKLTIKEATVKSFHYEDCEPLLRHLDDLISQAGRISLFANWRIWLDGAWKIDDMPGLVAACLKAEPCRSRRFSRMCNER
ncbi:hypothetical protein [Aquamicrobium sp.]|uniref:hypothetical protein n=1 Tax=Aquamicrobium sp. TaxID=1872579 RepID=UPI002590B9AA|nr:hypothetical protein [Aquamicrobium sp.]MCK9549448.1 hypothetical protein [Aquamicrobium sp.]